MAIGCRQCLPLSIVQLKGKHCRKPHCRNGVVDTFEHEVISVFPSLPDEKAFPAAPYGVRQAKTSVLLGFSKIERGGNGGGGAPDCYGGLT